MSLFVFFDEDENGVKPPHLASRKMNIANASALMLELKDILQSYGQNVTWPLPLDNNIIISLSAPTPSLIQCDSVCGAFTTLGKALPDVVRPEELGQLEEEVGAYQIDVDLVRLAKTYAKEDSRVDVDWWSRVAFLKTTERGVRYPTLIKLMKALLDFTGPLVEGSLNLMDILEADRCSMNVESYESLAIIQSTMKARNWTPSTMMIDQPVFLSK